MPVPPARTARNMAAPPLARALSRLAAVIRAALVGALLGPMGAAHAAWPEKPVRIVVPFPPGGGTDIIARTLGQAIAADLGQPVIVENKPGGGTIIGTDAVAKSAPDGYTFVVATFAHAVNPSLHPKLPFDTDRAFAPVVLIGRSPNVLVVPATSRFRSVDDVLVAARAQPGTITYASQGTGTSAHLAGEMFANLAKVNMTHVPYRGASAALTDLLGGRIDLMFATAAAVGAMVDGGKLRALGVTTAERSPALKDVPTIAERGVPGYVVESWYGLYAPAGTPAEIVTRLNAATRKAARSPAFVQRVQDEGLVVSDGPPELLDRYVKGEEARWRRIVRENGIKPE